MTRKPDVNELAKRIVKLATEEPQEKKGEKKPAPPQKPKPPRRAR